MAGGQDGPHSLWFKHFAWDHALQEVVKLFPLHDIKTLSPIVNIIIVNVIVGLVKILAFLETRVRLTSYLLQFLLEVNESRRASKSTILCIWRFAFFIINVI